MKYEQIAEIAKMYNQIQASQERLQYLEYTRSHLASNFPRIDSYEEAEALIKHHEDKIQRLKEELTNAAIGEL